MITVTQLGYDRPSLRYSEATSVAPIGPTSWPTRAIAYLQRYLLDNGGSLHEAVEQVTAGGLRRRRTADGTIARE